MKNVLITGANGFIGHALCKKMLADGCHVRGAVRGVTQMTTLPSGVEGALVGDIGPETDWSDALSGIEGIVHLAARTHIINDTALPSHHSLHEEAGYSNSSMIMTPIMFQKKCFGL